MNRWLIGMGLAWLLMQPLALAQETRPCILGVVGEQSGAYFRQWVPDVRKGDYLIARECWAQAGIFP